MTATIIAWIFVIALAGGLFFAVYKWGESSQATKDEGKRADDAANMLKMGKERENREKVIDSKPLPLDVDSVIDRLQ